ncbi:MAG: metalloregulator ArsR/SmtB family transcription factor [Deltaproteobacteria bacterium]|nr:metalloregulator ArsR/SmtB family transcription factor [Deltaproteobacteria bacterium]
MTSLFKALSDDNRLRILERLKSGEKCACVLLGDLTVGQPTLSHHMKILADSGLVKVRKSGKWSYYSIASETLQALAAYLNQLSEISRECVIDENSDCCR